MDAAASPCTRSRARAGVRAAPRARAAARRPGRCAARLFGPISHRGARPVAPAACRELRIRALRCGRAARLRAQNPLLSAHLRAPRPARAPRRTSRWPRSSDARPRTSRARTSRSAEAATAAGAASPPATATLMSRASRAARRALAACRDRRPCSRRSDRTRRPRDLRRRSRSRHARGVAPGVAQGLAKPVGGRRAPVLVSCHCSRRGCGSAPARRTRAASRGQRARAPRPGRRCCPATSTSSRPSAAASRCASSTRAKRSPAASDCARSFSWCGKIRSRPPPCTSKSSPSCARAIAEHSMCQPGRPRPQGESQAVSSSGLVGLPEREVERRVLALPRLDARAGDQLVGPLARQLAVVRVGLDAEVHVAVVARIGRAALDQPLDERR